MKNAPKKIYLNVGFNENDGQDFKKLREVAWSDHKNSTADIEYVLKEKDEEMKNPFKTKAEAIDWVQSCIPMLISPSRKSKYKWISPFSSNRALRKVINGLGERLFKLLDKVKR